MEPVVDLAGVRVRRGQRWLLDGIDLQVGTRDRWVVIGPNGAGKTTVLSIIAARLFPTSGTVRILGEELGAVDVGDLRAQIGWASSALIGQIPSEESVRDVVLTGAYAYTGRWREDYETSDLRRAQQLMWAWGVDHLADRTFGSLSEGERKRTMIARALMPDPELLLLDEPGAGLDLGGREDLVRRLRLLATDTTAPAIIMVTHHVEEIPPGFTHAMVISQGRCVAAGSIGEVVTSEVLSSAFGMPIDVDHAIDVQGQSRWTARLRAAGVPT